MKARRSPKREPVSSHVAKKRSTLRSLRKKLWFFMPTEKKVCDVSVIPRRCCVAASRWAFFATYGSSRKARFAAGFSPCASRNSRVNPSQPAMEKESEYMLIVVPMTRSWKVMKPPSGLATRCRRRNVPCGIPELSTLGSDTWSVPSSR